MPPEDHEIRRDARLEQLREERAEFLREAQTIVANAEAEDRELTEDEETNVDGLLDSADRHDKKIDREQRLAVPAVEQREMLPALRQPIDVFARAKDPNSEEKTYRPDRPDTSFLRDLVSAREGNLAARERLQRNEREALEMHGWTEQQGLEYRDNQNASTQGGDFVPPLYLSDLYVEPNIAARPLADALPKMALPPTGTAITIPKMSSGTSVAARSDAGAVSETDAVTATISHDVNEIAGHVDIGRILVMRSDPAFDQVIVRTLRRRYDAYLDTQLLSGSGTAPQHRGLDNVASPNTVTYTATTPTGALFLGSLYNAIQLIPSNRFEVFADLVVMHPRRAAWAAQALSSTVPLYQQGQLVQAPGQQNGGFAVSLGGIPILQDPNITTANGAGTNEDKVYVLAREDFILMEGPMMARVWDDVGSGNGVIRYSIFAFSAFLSSRYPKSLTIISGTGLVTPTWTGS